METMDKNTAIKIFLDGYNPGIDRHFCRVCGYTAKGIISNRHFDTHQWEKIRDAAEFDEDTLEIANEQNLIDKFCLK